MTEMYNCHLFWPTIAWVDFVVWSPHNFTVDTFTFDPHYYFKFYAPLEFKYLRLFHYLGRKNLSISSKRFTSMIPTHGQIQTTIKQQFTLPENILPTITEEIINTTSSKIDQNFENDLAKLHLETLF